MIAWFLTMDFDDHSVVHKLWRNIGLVSNHALRPVADTHTREDRDIDYVFRVLDIPWWYYGIAVVIGLVIGIWRRKPSLGMLVGYCFLILAETVLIRRATPASHFQPELFWSWRAWDQQREQILTNVVMFIPIGVLAGWLWQWKGLRFAVGLSVGIEVLQLITSRGLCEFDDVIHNIMGALIGVGIVILVRRIKEECR